MVTYPYLINNHFLPYKDIINPYPPILPFLLSLFSKAAGYLPEPYSIATWLAVFAVDLSIFIVIYKLAKNYYYAVVALIFFVFISIPFGINGLWFDLIQTPFIIFSVFYFYRYSNSNKATDLHKSFYLAIVAVFIKQQAVWLILFYLCTLIINNRKRLARSARDLFAPFVFFCTILLLNIIYLLKLGVLGNFVFWVLYQPFFNASLRPGYVLLPTIKQILIIFLPLTFIVVPNLFGRKKYFLLTITSLALIFFAYPRFDYFHLIPYLAIVSVALGVNLSHYKKLSTKIIAIPAVSLILLLVFFLHNLGANWQQPIRFFDRSILTAASFIAQTTPSGSILYMQNSPDQIFVLSNRLPVKPWADEFPWYLEINGIQNEIVTGIKNQNPKFVIFQPYSEKGKYALGSYRPSQIADYLDQNYMNLEKINDTLWLRLKK